MKRNPLWDKQAQEWLQSGGGGAVMPAPTSMVAMPLANLAAPGGYVAQGVAGSEPKPVKQVPQELPPQVAPAAGGYQPSPDDYLYTLPDGRKVPYIPYNPRAGQQQGAIGGGATAPVPRYPNQSPPYLVPKPPPPVGKDGQPIVMGRTPSMVNPGTAFQYRRSGGGY